MNISNIPQALRDYLYWCLWLLLNREGKPMKIPISPRTGAYAHSNDRETFAPFDVARAAYEKGGFNGLGIGLFGVLAVIDIDNCIDALGNLSRMAQDIVSMVRGYTELSPSGRGLHIFFLVPGFQYDTARYYINNKKHGIEVYVSGSTFKFITVTGNVLHQFPIADRSKEVSAVLDKYMRRNVDERDSATADTPAQGGKSFLSDDEVISKASTAKAGDKFINLWAGDVRANGGDWSAADMALCNRLAFWCNCDAAQMERLFRQSGLMRPKFDELRGEHTYGYITIQRAIASCRIAYTI